MFIASLTDPELEMLIMALKYWRRHRREGQVRKKDPGGPEDIDVLLAKLGTGVSPTGPTDGFVADLPSH